MAIVRAETRPAAGPYVSSAERVPLSVIWAYSIPRIAFGIMGSLFSIYLMKFSTDVLLIAPAVMGAMLAASRLWDAVSDPLVGYFSDRTHSRFGRRRIWMFVAAVPMGLSLIAVWSPPLGLDTTSLVIWMGVALLLYETASTAFFVPHGALGVELTSNYHERTRLFGYTHMIGAIGTILGLVALQLMTSAEEKRAFAAVLTFVGFLFLAENGLLIWVLMFALGIAGGCGVVIAPAIQADVIDYDEYMTGDRKEGAYIAVWNLVRKGAGALTALVTGFALTTAGFEPNVDQSETVQLTIRVVIGLVPAICFILAAVLLMRFNLNETEHRHVREELDNRG